MFPGGVSIPRRGDDPAFNALVEQVEALSRSIEADRMGLLRPPERFLIRVGVVDVTGACPVYAWQEVGRQICDHNDLPARSGTTTSFPAKEANDDPDVSEGTICEAWVNFDATSIGFVTPASAAAATVRVVTDVCPDDQPEAGHAIKMASERWI